MEMEELNEWVNAYIEVHESENSSNEDHSSYWAIEKFADMEMDHPDLNWVALPRDRVSRYQMWLER